MSGRSISCLPIIINRLRNVTVDRAFLPLAAHAVAHLNELTSEVFQQMTKSFLQDETQDGGTIIPCALSLLRAYASTKDHHNTSALRDVISKLEPYLMQSKQKEIAELLSEFSKVPFSEEEKKLHLKAFLPAVVEKANRYEPKTLSMVLKALLQLEAQEPSDILIQEIPRAYETATLDELRFIIVNLKRSERCPKDIGSFLWEKLTNHPDRAKLTPKSALDIFFASPTLRQRPETLRWLLSHLKDHIYEFKVVVVNQLFLWIVQTNALRNHPLMDEILKYLRQNYQEIPISSLAYTACAVLRFQHRLFWQTLKVRFLGRILRRFDKLPLSSYAAFIVHLSNYCSDQVIHATRLKLYSSLEKKIATLVLESNTARSLSNSDENTLALPELCFAFRKLVELRRKSGKRGSIERIRQTLRAILKKNLDAKLTFSLFSIILHMKSHLYSIQGSIRQLCKRLPVIVPEMTFSMCVQILLSLAAVPLKILDLDHVGYVVKRLSTMLRKNENANLITLRDLLLLMRSNLPYRFMLKTEWNSLLVQNAISIIGARHCVQSVAQAAASFVHFKIDMAPSLGTFLDCILRLTPGTNAQPSDVLEILYFTAVYAEPNATTTMIKHVLLLPESYKSFTLNDVNYILKTVKDCECDRGVLPSTLITFVYTTKFEFTQSGDIKRLFELLPHFEVDTHPSVYNLVNSPSAENPRWLAQASGDDLAVVLTTAMQDADVVNGPFITLAVTRFQEIIDQIPCPVRIQIIFAVLNLTVIQKRCGKPFFMHEAIDSVCKYVHSLTLRDIVLYAKTVQISAHIYPTKLLKPLVQRLKEILKKNPGACIVDINAALYGLHRIGMSDQKVFQSSWEFAYKQLTSKPQPHNLPVHRFVDRLLHTMILTKVVHIPLIRHLIAQIPTFDETKVTFPVASRLYNSCAKLVVIDESLASSETLDTLKNMCMLGIFHSPVPVNVSFFVEATSLRFTKMNSRFDEESVSAILILAHRVHGVKHHLTSHCMKQIFKHLECFGICPENAEWLSENGRVRALVDSGYITSTHVSRFAETYALYFKKSFSDIHTPSADAVSMICAS